MVREYERASAAALHIEDQTFPKRCGHLPGRDVIPVDDMVQKIKAAVDARREPDFVVSSSEGGGIETNRCFRPLYLLYSTDTGAVGNATCRAEGLPPLCSRPSNVSRKSFAPRIRE